MNKFYYKLKSFFLLESKFTTAYLKEFKDDWWWCHKISDLAGNMKPFDWFGVNKWWLIFCDAKVIENDMFKISSLRNNQLTALERIHLVSEKYWFSHLVFPVVQVYSKNFNDYKFIHIKEIIKIEDSWETDIIIDF